MVQFQILSGKSAGSTCAVRRFPVRVGRSPHCDLRYDDDGVWDEHFRVSLDRKEGFVAATQGHALLRVDGQPVERATLRNGSVLEAGALKLRFSISDPRQRSLVIREALVWAMLVLVSLAQIVLIYQLL